MAMIEYVVVGYITVLSMIGYVLMGVDKNRARKKAWRIPESTLLGVALVGGGIGCFLGMHTFRHKTRHKKFTILLPLTAVVYLTLILQII